MRFRCSGVNITNSIEFQSVLPFVLFRYSGMIVTILVLVILATVYDSFIRPSLMKSYVEGLKKKEKVAFQRSVSQVSTGE